MSEDGTQLGEALDIDECGDGNRNQLSSEGVHF